MDIKLDLREAVLPNSVGEAAEAKTDISRPPSNLAEVLTQLESKPSASRDHIQTKTALRTLGRALRRPLCDIPAMPSELQKLLALVSAAAVPISEKTWGQYRSLTLAALRTYYPDLMPGRSVAGHSRAWTELRETLPTLALKNGLSRFMSHCSMLGIEPYQVTAEVFEAFRLRLMERSLQQRPEKLFRQSVVFWNRAVAAAPDWPCGQIALERSARFYAKEWEEFPPSFVQELEAFLGREADQDILAKVYRRPLKPGTIVVRRRLIRQVASLLVASGFPISEIVSLSILVDSENATAALRAQLARQGVQTDILRQQASILGLIAKYWVKDLDRAAELREIAMRLKKKQTGINDKNRRRLNQV